MINKQKIINFALVRIGDSKLTSTTQAFFEMVWDVGVQILLSESYWNFAQKITQLGLDTDTYEIKKYKYKYFLPADFATIYSVYNPSNETVKIDYTIVGNFLYANQFPLECRYVTSTPEEVYPAHFADLLSLWLAAEICVSIGAADQKPILLQQLEKEKQKARVINGKDIPSATYDNSYYSTSRY